VLKKESKGQYGVDSLTIRNKVMVSNEEPREKVRNVGGKKKKKKTKKKQGLQKRRFAVKKPQNQQEKAVMGWSNVSGSDLGRWSLEGETLGRKNFRVQKL